MFTEFLREEEAAAIADELRASPEDSVEEMLHSIDHEIRWGIKVIQSLDEAVRPARAAAAFEKFVGALARARTHWERMGEGGRTAFGLALSEDADKAWLRRYRDIASPDRGQGAVDLRLIFHATDEVAAQTVTELLEHLATIAAWPATERLIEDLPKYPSSFAEEKRVCKRRSKTAAPVVAVQNRGTPCRRRGPEQIGPGLFLDGSVLELPEARRCTRTCSNGPRSAVGSCRRA